MPLQRVEAREPACGCRASLPILQHRLTHFKVGTWLRGGIVAVIHHSAVQEDHAGAAIDAERITGPENDIGILARLQRANAIIEPQRLCRIDRDPLDGALFGYVDASTM